MLDHEPKGERDAHVNVSRHIEATDGINGDVKMALGAAEGEKRMDEEQKDDGVRMEVQVEEDKKNSDDVKRVEDEDVKKDGGLVMAEASEAKKKDEDVRTAESGETRKKDDDVKMTDVENASVAEDEGVKLDDSLKEKGKDVIEDEAEDGNKDEAGDVKNKASDKIKKEETEGMKKEETNDMKIEEAEGRKKDKVEEDDEDTDNKQAVNMKKEEGDNAQDVEMEEADMKETRTEDYKNMGHKENGDAEDKVQQNNKAESEATGSKKKRKRGRKVSYKGEANEKKESDKKAKEHNTPVASSIERPVRERKSVERLVEALDNEFVKPFIIEKGRGTPLKDIPNVAYKIGKKKSADLRPLHQTLFGRVGKANSYKTHLLEFSGFVWHESEDKQKTKVKEKLDKCVKDTLLEFCNLFDIPLQKAKSNARKEELVAMLLDFMVAPHATTDVILSDKEQSKSNKRKSGASESESKSSKELSGKRSKKEDIKSENTETTKGSRKREMEDEETEKGVSSGDDVPEKSEGEDKEMGSVGVSEDDKDDDDSGKDRRGGSSNKKLKVSEEPQKISSSVTGKSPKKSSSLKIPAAKDKSNGSAKASKKQKTVESPKKNKVAPKTDSKEKLSGKKVVKDKSKSAKSKDSGPSKEELRQCICEILKKVDFNTATFTDILKELASQYKIDLTPRKAAIKLMIQEELTKLAEEDDDDEDEDGDVEDDEDNDK